MTPGTAARVLSAGAGLKVKVMSPDALVSLATIAKQHKVKLEIKDSLSPNNMIRVAAAGTGSIHPNERLRY